MKSHGLLLGAAILLIGGGMASAEQQYDSLGSPTPAPNQNAAPDKVEPNVPVLGDNLNPHVANPTTGGTRYTTGAGTPRDDTPKVTTTPVDKPPTTPSDTGETPSGLTPD